MYDSSWSTICQIGLLLYKLAGDERRERIIGVGHICVESPARRPATTVVLLSHSFHTSVVHWVAEFHLQYHNITMIQS